MHARRIRLRESHDVVIAAMDRMHERRESCAIGQPQTEHAGIECRRLVDTGGEGEQVRQTARPHHRRLDACAGAHHAFRRRRPDTAHLGIGRNLWRNLHFDQQAGRIATPQPVAFQTEWSVEDLDAVLFHALLEIGQILGIAAERKVMQPFGRAFDHASPAMIAAGAVQFQAVARVADIETEVAVELFRDFQVRDCEHKLIERVNADFSLMHGGLRNASDCCHGRFLPAKQAKRRPRRDT